MRAQSIFFVWNQCVLLSLAHFFDLAFIDIAHAEATNILDLFYFFVCGFDFTLKWLLVFFFNCWLLFCFCGFCRMVADDFNHLLIQ